MKIKFLLSVALASAVSTTAFAASDTSQFTRDGYAINNQKISAVAPDSNSSARLNNSASNRKNGSTDYQVAALTLNSDKSPPHSDSSRSAGDSHADIVMGGKNGNDEIATNSLQGSDALSSSANGVAPANQNDTCMGSKSTGMQLPIVGGIAFGSSWTDKNCMMIKNARELWKMGYKKAALARMCMDGGNREALESTGTPCPLRRDESTATKTESASLTYLQ